MLPTLIFVVCAYLVYALVRICSGHNRKQFQPYKCHRSKARLGWIGGTGVGLGIIILLFIVGLPCQDDNLRTASIISATWVQEPVMPAQAMQRQEMFPLKNQIEQGQPAYAYLHPETPAPQMLPEKKARGPRRLQKPGVNKAAPRAKAVKVVAKAPKKEKAPPAKTRAKKKKPNAAAEYLAANSG
ncbi:MAG: hypothetical protein ACYDIC_10180 [Desulfobaccales bacterium]